MIQAGPKPSDSTEQERETQDRKTEGDTQREGHVKTEAEAEAMSPKARNKT